MSQKLKEEREELESWESIRGGFERLMHDHGKRGNDMTNAKPHRSLSGLLDAFVAYLTSSLSSEVKNALEGQLGAKGRCSLADFMRLQSLHARAEKGKV